MWFTLVLCVVSVSGRGIDDIRDRYIPRTDFGYSDTERGYSGGGFRGFTERPQIHDRRSFSTEFNHRQFYHSDDRNSRGFGERHNFGSFKGYSSRGSSDFGDFNSQDFRRNGVNRDIERSHGIETLGHGFGSVQGSETRIHDGIYSHRATDNYHNVGVGHGFENFGSDQFNTHGSHTGSDFTESFQRKTDENHKVNNLFNRQKTNHEGSKTEINQRKLQDENEEDNQKDTVNKHKQEFEIISTNHRKDNQNSDKENKSQNLESYPTLHTNAPHYHENTKTELRTDIHNESPTNKTEQPEENKHTRSQDENIKVRSNTNIDNNRNDQRTYAKATTDNEIYTTVQINEKKGIRVNQGKELEDDRWIWEDGDKKNVTSTISPKTVDLDDRAAFNGDKCPTGKVKIGNMCVDID